MLGDKLGEETGQVIGTRILRSETGPKVETSFRAQGRLLGIDIEDTGTYVATARPDGTLYGEGQGVMMGAGGEMASWIGSGIGSFEEGGTISYRGAVYYSTAVEAWGSLNTVAAVFEYEVDAEGKVHGITWAWS